MREYVSRFRSCCWPRPSLDGLGMGMGLETFGSSKPMCYKAMFGLTMIQLCTYFAVVSDVQQSDLNFRRSRNIDVSALNSIIRVEY